MKYFPHNHTLNPTPKIKLLFAMNFGGAGQLNCYVY